MSQVKNLTLGGKNSGEISIQISINLKVYRPKKLPKFSFEKLFLSQPKFSSSFEVEDQIRLFVLAVSFVISSSDSEI